MAPVHNAIVPSATITDQKARGFSDFRILGGIEPRSILCLKIDIPMVVKKNTQAIALTSAFPCGDHRKPKESSIHPAAFVRAT